MQFINLGVIFLARLLILVENVAGAFDQRRMEEREAQMELRAQEREKASKARAEAREMGLRARKDADRSRVFFMRGNEGNRRRSMSRGTRTVSP